MSRLRHASSSANVGRSANSRPTPDDPGFRPFDPGGEVQIYVRNLPHWRQPGATYFVTFRQVDSIPARVLKEWHEDRQRWLRANQLDLSELSASPERFAAAYLRIAAGVRKRFEREQARISHEQLDRCHGSCVLQYESPRKIVVDSLHHFHGNRFWLGDAVVMPNHVHAIMTPKTGFELEDLLGSIKKWTSRRIGEWLRTPAGSALPASSRDFGRQLWQVESYDRIIRDAKELASYRRYIANNGPNAMLRPDQYGYEPAEWLDTFAPRGPFE